FSGSLELAKSIIKEGFYLGIGGVLTFKNAGLAEVVTQLPMEYLILETDAPYLAPVPYRGKRNEPAYIPLVAEKLAALKSTAIEEVETLTTKNAMELFNLTDDNA
ncbi:MAG TPA: TatD family hydrolase, partial [Niabella sp.]|nr:TatD family hydrolase [Niabella sp.]